MSSLSELVNFLAQIKANNSKIWFDVHRNEYKAIDSAMKELVMQIIKAVAQFDETVGFLTPNDCTYRINHDVRFSHDKSPYKTWYGIVLSMSDKNGSQPGYYAQINADNECMIGGGWYIPESKKLFHLRSVISNNPKSLRSILAQADFQKLFGGLSGEKLKLCPKGFSKLDPSLDLITYKNFTAIQTISTTDMADNIFVQKVVESFKIIHPLVEHLRKTSLLTK